MLNTMQWRKYHEILVLEIFFIFWLSAFLWVLLNTSISA